MQTQTRLNGETQSPFYGTTYNRPQYNAIKGEVQRIELHRGCPWHHEYCYEPQINEDFPIPEIVKNQVEILDMNFLVRKDALEIIKQLGEIRVDDKVVSYEFICGLDYRFLTQDIANQLKVSRFTRIRLAWDDPLSEQKKIKNAIQILIKAGYKRNELMLFMIVNWRIPYTECLRKLDLMKVWGVKVCDCCYDGGYAVAVPVYWTQAEISSIRKISRKHNQLVLFGIDPQPTIDPTYLYCTKGEVMK
jgi:hypothetical protein